IFSLPTYYSFDAGSLHVTVLDSNDWAWTDMGSQTAWLRRDLASSSPWKFAAFHHPPFTADRKSPGGNLAKIGRASCRERFSRDWSSDVCSSDLHLLSPDILLLRCRQPPCDSP